MGFSSSLHGKAAHEALLGRQEAELDLVDLMRHCIVRKVRADRDYSQALTAVVQQGQKLGRPDELAGSPITQAWRGMTEEIENLAKAIRLKADCLEKETVEKFNALYAEKQKARKVYQEEHARISAQFNQLSEDVTKKKMEYQKALDSYKMLRGRFEEQYIKAGRSGRKLDDVRDKCQKACRKLHLTHNEYVLLLSEATEVEDEYRTVLLPSLIETQHAIQESFIADWRTALQEFARCMNLSGDTFAEIQARLVNCGARITAADEYKEYYNRYKSNAISPVSIVFDKSLVEDVSVSLQPNTLVVDNLTIEWLRNKQCELELALRVNQERQQAALSSPTAETNGSLTEGFRIPILDSVLRLGKTPMPENKEFTEAKSEERRLTRQAEVIKAALATLGCEEVPTVCDLSMDSTFIEGNDGLQGEEQSPPFGQKRNVGPQQRLANILRKPFRRKSVTTSPGSTRRFGGEDELGVGLGVGVGGGVSNGVDRDRDRDREADILVRTLTDMDADDGQDAIFCAEHVRSLIQRTPCFLLNNAMDCVMLPDNQPTANTSLELTSLECDMDTAGNEGTSLSEEEWFHGVLPREEVHRLLTREGDFLVRETTRNDECQTVLSVCWGGHKHFIVQTTAEGQYRFEGPSFPTIAALINHQYESGLPVTSRSGAILRHPIPRERWELNNDDIILGEKIGRGNFGDVHKGTLKSGRQEVAVKTCRGTLHEDHKRKFLQEGRILKQYDHPNVVKLIGIAVQKQPIMIVMELVPGGSLLTFLRNHRLTLTGKQLCGMCRDVAAGMRYLESKNCIHRDLAARNCLVGYDNIVKISDFGMSREEEEYIVSDGMKQIPIKWTAPEALNFGKYTSLCDVWSYGILAWEVFSRGDAPYTGFSNTKAREKIDEGYRMPAPQGTPDEMYQLMLRCWEYKPERRPHFTQIYKDVDSLYSSYR